MVSKGPFFRAAKIENSLEAEKNNTVHIKDIIQSSNQ